jgi:carbonic anhydrase
MDKLLEGYRRFHQTYYQQNRKIFSELAQGQAPKVMVISCCDSRVSPLLIFHAAPGEIFTLRNVASLVPPYVPDGTAHSTSAAIEYAVTSLKVSHVVVLAHAGCGGVKALLSAQRGTFIGPWIDLAKPAREKAISAIGIFNPAALQRRCEYETVKLSLENLMSFPWVQERVAAGDLQLHGCYFDIEGGELLMLDSTTGEFKPAPTAEA